MSYSHSVEFEDTDSHVHSYPAANPLAERRISLVVALTAVMMLIEISAGWMFHSMALLADGWHMSSHVLALGLAAGAYACARRLSRDARFAFGTWKIEVLGGYTSALCLLAVAAYMLYESCARLNHPSAIAFSDAIVVAALGLLVNLVSAALLGGAAHGHAHTDRHAHDHDRDHGHEHSHKPSAHAATHADLNLRSAYIHVAADAGMSVLAIAALLGGKLFGLNWLDPVMGLLGALVVGSWSLGLLRATGRVLLDAEMDAPMVGEIRRTLRDSGLAARLQDLHVWRVGTNRYACLVCVATPTRATPADFRQLLAAHEQLVHVTVEVNHT